MKTAGSAWAMRTRYGPSEGGKLISTNTVEGYFGIFKRGMTGIYQHCAEHQLQKYLNEFDFRYSHRIALGIDDTERTRLAVKGAAWKRLTCRQPRAA
jgi:ISXO2-like transposase domain